MEANASRREIHVHTVSALSRIGWQDVTGYCRRAMFEGAKGRYKAVSEIGCVHETTQGGAPKLGVGAVVLNRMLAAGCPNSVRTVSDVARPPGERGNFAQHCFAATMPRQFGGPERALRGSFTQQRCSAEVPWACLNSPICRSVVIFVSNWQRVSMPPNELPRALVECRKRRRDSVAS